MLSREATLERERRWARLAAISAILVPILFVPQRFLLGQFIGPVGGLETDVLPYIQANSSELFLLQTLRGLSFVAMIAPLMYLFYAARARSDRVSPALVAFVFIGPLLFAVQAILTAVAQQGLVDDFVAEVSRGGDVYGLLRSLGTDSTLSSTASTILLPAILGLMVAMIYVPLQAMRTGLLTRFSATFAMALAASMLLLSGFFGVPLDIPILFMSFWFLFVGLLILGVGPRRPPAWDAGVAMPWPKPGEEARPVEQPARPEEFGGSRDEGEGEGEFGRTEPAVNPNAARRERAKRKRRKQRRG
ncbi:hypothetical protein HJD18_01120 [Thermoleophilia bacterium SCSIO 60948]|nr:hypothetical protein HJD18_01120 [Thermoleophilia bacterium SCSIO 60948]